MSMLCFVCKPGWEDKRRLPLLGGSSLWAWLPAVLEGAGRKVSPAQQAWGGGALAAHVAAAAFGFTQVDSPTAGLEGPLRSVRPALPPPLGRQWP